MVLLYKNGIKKEKVNFLDTTSDDKDLPRFVTKNALRLELKRQS